MPQTKENDYQFRGGRVVAYRWASVYSDTHAAEMLIEAKLKVNILLACANDQVIWSWFHKIEYL
jgi:hypothetical protein